jgi:tetratricopeptide (TPR) repeat protein
MPENSSLKEEIDQLRAEGDRAYEGGQWEAALSKYKAMTALTITLNLKSVMAEGYRKCGHIERMRGNFRAAEKMFQKALAISTSDGDMPGITDTLKGLSTLFFRKGEYGQAMRYGQEALSNARTLKDPGLLGGILIDVGNIYCVTGNYDEGVRSYEEALNILPQKEFLQIGRALNNIGETHKRFKRYDKAIESLEKAITLGLDKGDPINRAWSLFCAAECYTRLGNPDKASEYLDDAEPLLKEAADEVGLQELYKVRGLALRFKGDIPGAKAFFEQSIRLGKKLMLPTETASAYVELGTMLKVQNDKEGAKGCFAQAQALYQGVRLQKELDEAKYQLDLLMK